MDDQLSTLRIAGVALLLFSGVILGVGIHHLVGTGTCSSTGYSANYGPVPHCPSGTGAWFGFVFGGIIGALVGSMMAGSVALVFASIFGGIGFGALSLLFDPHVSSGTHIFAAAFGGCFALVSVIAWIAVLGAALSGLRRPGSPGATTAGSKTRISGSRRGHGGPRTVGSGLSSPSPGMPAPAGGGFASATPPGAFIPSTAAPASFVAPTSTAASAAGAIDSLAKLGELHRQGLLTDAEFAQAKSKFLGAV